MEHASRRGHKMKILYADGAYGSDDNWKIISREYKCKFVTSFKISISPTNNGYLARGEADANGAAFRTMNGYRPQDTG